MTSRDLSCERWLTIYRLERHEDSTMWFSGNDKSFALGLRAGRSPFGALLRAAARTGFGPLRAYVRSRSQARAAGYFAGVNMHTLEDIGLLPTHLVAVCANGDNDNDPAAGSVIDCGISP